MMTFDSESFSSTVDNFQEALKKRKLEISVEKARKLWAKILHENDYTELISQLKDGGSINVQFSEVNFIAKMQACNLAINNIEAFKIFAESIRPNLDHISPMFNEILKVLDVREGLSIIPYYLESNKHGIGLIEKGKPGYLPLPTDKFSIEGDYDYANSVAELIKVLAGRDLEHVNIFVSMMKASLKRENDAFMNLLKNHKDEYVTNLSPLLFHEINENLDKVDFNFLVYTAYDLIDISFKGYNYSHLKSDSPLVESFIDYVSGSMLRYIDCVKDIEDRTWDPKNVESVFSSCVDHYLEITQNQSTH